MNNSNTLKKGVPFDISFNTNTCTLTQNTQVNEFGGSHCIKTNFSSSLTDSVILKPCPIIIR